MNPEFLELAHEAVAALQSAPPPTWVEIAALAEPGVWLIGLPFMYWQLWQMEKYGRQRTRIVDEQCARLAEIGRQLEESSRQLRQQLAQQRQARLHPSH